MSKLFKVTSSPHIRHQDSTRGIMLDVIIALLPAAIYGCVLFGPKAVLVLFTTIATAVAAEALWNIALHKQQTIGDLSAVLTGLLLGMNLSSETPLWIAAIGSVVAIIVVKQMFGGLGFNFANPAMTARIVLLASFAGQLSNYAVQPLDWLSGVDATTTATPMSSETSGQLYFGLQEIVADAPQQTTYTFKQLFLGQHNGAIGETCSFLLIIGGIYLMLRRVIKPIIPVSFIGTVAIATLVANLFTKEDVSLTLAIFGGGLMLGAIFMATDYVTSPTTNLGKLIFGVGCGLLTFVIRTFSPLPEGVSYAILLMNILTPHINRLTLSKPFGAMEVASK